MIKSEIIDAIEFVKTLNAKKIINGFILRLSYLLSRLSGIFVHWGNVEFLSIEPTNLCNLKCPECPSGTNNLNRARLFLSEGHYKTIIDSCYKHLSYLQLFFQGEPFLHPKLSNFIAYATTKNIYTSISTNGLFLDTRNCKNIIESGLNRIIISLDGTTQEVYEKYRVGGDVNSVISGIKHLVNEKQKRKSTTPFIILQFVVTAQNEHQIINIKQLAKEIKVDKLVLKSAQIESFNSNFNLIPENKKYSRYKQNTKGEYVLNRKHNFKCKRIWYGSVVAANNNFLPCCFDKKAKHSYNTNPKAFNINDWKSNSALSFRKKVWKNYTAFEMCRNCTEGLKTRT